MVVGDPDANMVKVLSCDGKCIFKIDYSFICPVGVAVDSDDNIIVSDWPENICVSVIFILMCSV